MRALIAAVVALAAIATTTPVHAVDPPECVVDDASAVATVTPVGGSARIDHDGNAIYVDGVACGTLTTVDRIDVVGALGGDDALTIVLANGQFGPGKTDEGDGSSEIEFGLSGHLRLTIEGGDGAERIAAGVSGGSRFNLDTTETTPDADLQISTSDLRSLTVDLGAGNDAFSGAGGSGTGDFFLSLADVPVAISMGDGTDLFAPGISQPATYAGGPGADVFSVRWVECGSLLRLPDSTGTLCLTGPSFDLASFERIRGTLGDDFIVTTNRDEVVHGFAGQDTITGSRGTDVFDGGIGLDGAAYGQLDRRIVGDLRDGSVTGGGDDQLIDIEILGGTAYDDVLFGNARDNRLIGLAGRDELVGRRGADTHDGGDGRDDCHQRDATAGDTFTGCER